MGSVRAAWAIQKSAPRHRRKVPGEGRDQPREGEDRPRAQALQPRFEEATKRRLGATGVFVEVSGKYHLDEARLKQVQQQRGGAGGGWASRRNMLTVGTARMVIGIAAMALVITNLLFVGSAYLRLATLGLARVDRPDRVPAILPRQGEGRMGASGISSGFP